MKFRYSASFVVSLLLAFAAGTAAAAQAPGTSVSRANLFNRLMKEKAPVNLPPAKDGIHDPESSGTELLQTPKTAFGPLDKAKYGNHVDWVKSMTDGKIDPRWDRLDPEAKPITMDLSIVSEVKGSMPDSVFPHKQHTELLDCSNCHPDIFVPQKGANPNSMAAIMLGEKCGVCHGKVAFPIATSTCRICHAAPKKAGTALKRSAPAKR